MNGKIVKYLPLLAALISLAGAAYIAFRFQAYAISLCFIVSSLILFGISKTQ